MVAHLLATLLTFTVRPQRKQYQGQAFSKINFSVARSGLDVTLRTQGHQSTETQCASLTLTLTATQRNLIRVGKYQRYVQTVKQDG